MDIAVIATGGKQYTVSKGDKLRVEKLEGEVGDVITFDQVLLRASGDKAEVGTPLVPSASVKAKIVDQARAKKVIVFRFHNKNRYKKKKGHRQHYTEIEIESVK